MISLTNKNTLFFSTKSRLAGDGWIVGLLGWWRFPKSRPAATSATATAATAAETAAETAATAATAATVATAATSATAATAAATAVAAATAATEARATTAGLKIRWGVGLRAFVGA